MTETTGDGILVTTDDPTEITEIDLWQSAIVTLSAVPGTGPQMAALVRRAQAALLQAEEHGGDSTLALQALILAHSDATRRMGADVAWLVQNTATIFQGFAEMQQAGGIGALLGGMMGGDNNGG